MRHARLGAAAAVLVLLAGCGDSELWERWRAERAFWHAQREVERILVRPQVAKPSDFVRAEAGFRSIVRDFPASRWARAGATGTSAESRWPPARNARASRSRPRSWPAPSNSATAQWA